MKDKARLRSLKILIKESVRRILKESKCPHCGDPEAYEGLFSTECPNKDCQAYSEKQAFATGRLGADQRKREKTLEYFRELANRINKSIDKSKYDDFFYVLGVDEYDNDYEDGAYMDKFIDDYGNITLTDDEDGNVISLNHNDKKIPFDVFKTATKHVKTPDEFFDVLNELCGFKG